LLELAIVEHEHCFFRPINHRSLHPDRGRIEVTGPVDIEPTGTNDRRGDAEGANIG
jgi:hypothetical protein